MQKTIENLSKAFVGESQARNRYTIYAKIAKKEGFEQISDIFLETAEHEREHAKQLFMVISKLKKDSQINEIKIETDACLVLGDTKENLLSAINGESHEREIMYPEFAEIAKREGLEEISNKLLAIAKAESYHEERFKKLLQNIENNSVFENQEEVVWVCKKCGYLHTGKSAPEKCLSCNHPTSYFSLQVQNY